MVGFCSKNSLVRSRFSLYWKITNRRTEVCCPGYPPNSSMQEKEYWILCLPVSNTLNVISAQHERQTFNRQIFSVQWFMFIYTYLVNSLVSFCGLLGSNAIELSLFLNKEGNYNYKMRGVQWEETIAVVEKLD